MLTALGLLTTLLANICQILYNQVGMMSCLHIEFESWCKNKNERRYII